jgi:hypothetical protein
MDTIVLNTFNVPSVKYQFKPRVVAAVYAWPQLLQTERPAKPWRGTQFCDNARTTSTSCNSYFLLLLQQDPR